MICDGADFLRLTSSDPFAGQPSGPGIVRFVSTLGKRGQPSSAIPLNFPSDGDWCLRVLIHQHPFVLGLYRRQMKAISYLGRIEKVFGASATTRNWNTILAVAKILKNAKAV
jgi:hypothetical protein